jgi:uncharacterized protein (UPF0548 family)
MLFLRKPSEHTIRSLLAQRQAIPFSYPHVGATRTAPPAGWRINHMRQLIGAGPAVHERVAAALFSWRLLAIDSLQVFPSTPTLQAGTNVAILSRHLGIWSVDFCRVIYVLHGEPEQGGKVLRTGFGYGTLPGHSVHGEEIFSLEWHSGTEEVWYDIYSFSLPATRLISVIAPVARATQRRFARASLERAAKLAAYQPK